MSHQKEVCDTLTAMGFMPDQINYAWDKCDIKTVEGLIDFIEKNPNPPSPDLKLSAPASDAKVNVNIEKYVKKELVDALVAKNTERFMAEKAVLLSGNENEEKALQWLENHKNDADFREPVVIEEKPQMSPEEAAQKARELQDKIRKKIKEDEEKNALESEKLRIKMGKEITEQRRILDEQQKKRDAELYLLEKQKDERDKQEMYKILEADKRARFGDKYVEPEKKKPKGLGPDMDDTYDKMYKIYRLGQLSLLFTCMKTLHSICERVVNNPSDPSLRNINALNPNFCQRVKDVIGGVQFLTYMGFEEKDDKFIMEHVDLAKLKQIEEFLKQKRDHLASTV